MAYTPVPYSSASAAAATRGINLSEAEQNTLHLSGKTPDELRLYIEASHILITGLSASEASDLYGGQQFNYGAMKAEFRKVCPDMGMDLDWTTKSLALEFSAKMLFEVGPTARRLKKADGDKIWKMAFLSEVDEVKSYGTVFVCTYKASAPPKTMPVFHNHRLMLTIKQASLLATEILTDIIPMCLQHESVIMTPLCGAIFAKQDLDKIIVHLNRIPDNTIRASILTAMVQSCQSGGQHLPNSKSQIAAVAAIIATRPMKDRKAAEQICRKTVRQYLTAQKVFDREQFKVYARYATGGVPADLEPSVLTEIVDEEQKIKRAALLDLERAQGVEQAQLDARVNIAGDERSRLAQNLSRQADAMAQGASGTSAASSRGTGGGATRKQ